jgi:hypothetical protein
VSARSAGPERSMGTRRCTRGAPRRPEAG